MIPIAFDRRAECQPGCRYLYRLNRVSVAHTNPFFDFAIVAFYVTAPVEFAVASVNSLFADQIVAPATAHRCAPIAADTGSVAPATDGSCE